MCTGRASLGSRAGRWLPHGDVLSFFVHLPLRVFQDVVCCLAKEGGRDSIQHEVGKPASLQHLVCLAQECARPRHADFHQAVESEHTDDANVQTVARVLAGLVTAAQRDVGPLVQVEAGSCAEFLFFCQSFATKLKEATHDSLQKEVGKSLSSRLKFSLFQVLWQNAKQTSSFRIASL